MLDADGNRVLFGYDAAQHTHTITNRMGHATTYTYDSDGDVTQIEDALGYTVTYTHDDHGNVLTETDPLGFTTVSTYDGEDNLTSKTNPVGYTVGAGYNSRGQVETLEDQAGQLLRNVYDANGALLEIHEATGSASSFVYNADGRPTSYTDQLGQQMQFGYNAQGNVTSLIDPGTNRITFTPDLYGNVLEKQGQRTTPQGAVTLTTKNHYDTANRLVWNQDAAGYESRVEYNALGQQAAYVDKRGFRIAYQYDALSNLRRVDYPDGTYEAYDYNVEGQTIWTRSREGRETTSVYDELGRLTRACQAGICTRTVYDERGQVQEQWDERNHATYYTYDPAGRNTAVRNALGFSTFYTYRLNGELERMTDANAHHTGYAYDANGRRTMTIFHDTTFTETAYDDAGRVTDAWDQNRHHTQFRYDWRGKLTLVRDPLGFETGFDYDEVGNLLAQTDAEGHATSFEYDNLGRQTSRILPLGQRETLAYDGEDNLVSRTDFNGQTIAYQYDSDGRVTRKAAPDGTVTYTYAANGSERAVADARGALVFRYDPLGRLSERRDPQTGALSYGYDAAGNRTSVMLPSGAVTATYDVLNRLETVVDPQTGTTRYTYDNVGNLKRVTYPNGTVAEYTYDPLNRLTYLENRTSGGTILSSYTYTLDAAGNRTRVVEHTGRTVAYEYDDTYKLTKETIKEPGKPDHVISYTYDKVGNRTTKTDNGFTTTYQYDANNRLTQEDDIQYTYDNNGNLKAKHSAEENILYSYDSDNHLIRVETTRFGATIVVEYVYDADGNRVRKTIDGTVVVNYLVDTNRDYAQVVEERDGGGNLLARYVYGHDLISQTRGGATSYYHYDGLGSTRALSNGSAAVTDTYTYDAFGVVLEQTGATRNDYLYRGEQFDAEVGFYYLRTRYMDPNVGRFVTMDSFAGSPEDPYSLHKYLYANANPINRKDPSGQSSLVETQIAGSIQSILAGIQSDIGFAIFDQIAEGGNAGLTSLAMGGLMTIFGPALVNMMGNLIEMGGEAVGKFLASKASAGDALANIFRKFSKKIRCEWLSRACFTGETLIFTKEGQKPIKDIQVGDWVFSENVGTGEKGFKRVKQVFVRETLKLVHLFIGDIEITTTPEHPFWVPDQGWTPAGQLTVGTEVKFVSDERAKITTITQEVLTQPMTVYNLEVEDWHTYVVSKKGVLVHNGCGWEIPKGARVKDIVGDTLVKPGKFQFHVDKIYVEPVARDMLEDGFDWNNMLKRGEWDPMRFVRLPDGTLIIEEGHHRFVAAQLTNTPIPWDNPRAVIIRDEPWFMAAKWDEIEWGF